MADDKRTQQVGLGCGTLIVIALIVMFFSGRRDRELEQEVRSLRSEVGELKQAVETQSSEIRQLRERLPSSAKADEGKAKE